MELKKLFKEKDVKIFTLAAAAYVVAIYFISQSFDLLSAILYISAAFLIAKIFKVKKKRTIKNYFIIGAVLSAGYHLIGQALGLFAVSPAIMIVAALEQGIVALIIAWFMGVRK